MREKKRVLQGLSLAVAAMLLQGCAIIGGGPLVSQDTKFRIMTPQVDPGMINKYTQFLAEQISRNRDTYNISNNPVAITSFVNLENLKHTNKLGELIADNMIHEMQIRGFNVTDFKAMPAIQVSNLGDFVRSREARELRTEHNINLVLSGTYTNHGGGVIVNARMINLVNGMVVSTAQANIPREIATAIFDNYNMDELSVSTMAAKKQSKKIRAGANRMAKRRSNQLCFDSGVCIRGSSR